jgi:hypothetical protein
MLVNRELTKEQSSVQLDSVDQEAVFQICLRRRFVSDRIDGESRFRTARQQYDDRILMLSADKTKLIKQWLDQLDSIGPDSTKKQGVDTGVDYDPERDARIAEMAICALVFDRVEPVPWASSGLGPYFA